jgi:predicted amidohydrolase
MNSGNPLLAVGQMNSGNDVEANFKVAQTFVEKAASRKAAMLCLPECFAYLGAASVPTGNTVPMAEPLTGPLMSKYCGLARKHNIWLSLGGFQEKSDKPDKQYNTHVIVNNQGNIVSSYRKIHLFDVDIPNGNSHRESSYTTPGNQIVTCDSPVGKLGLTVCYDMRFPELYASLAKAGAQILMVPAAFTLRTGLAHWHILLRARAIENQCFVVAAAQAGVHNPNVTVPVDKEVKEDKEAKKPGPLRESYGHACVIDPWGTVIAEASDGVGLTFAEIDLEKITQIRTAMPVSQHHRPDIFKQDSEKSYALYRLNSTERTIDEAAALRSADKTC